MDKQRVIETEIDGQAVRLTVNRATTIMGTRRSIMVYKAMSEIRGETEAGNAPDEAVMVLKTSTYPALITATTDATGIPWPLPFADFLELPEALVYEWEQAVFELNPHWNPAGEIGGEQEQEKKASKSTAESSAT